MLLISVCSVIFSFFVVTFAADCSIEDVRSLNGTYWSLIVLDSHIGIIEEFQTENISEAYIEDPIYFDLKLENNVLTVFTTDKFAEYEKEQTKRDIKSEIKTICNGVSDINSLAYYLQIEDTNTYEPTFNNDHYIYKFYDSLSKGIDIAEFASLYVTDYDLENYYMEFEIEDNEYLDITNSYKGIEKEYYAKLETKEFVKGPLNVTFKITATDSGDPAKSSSANLTLIITSPADIKFTQSVYTGYIGSNGEVFIKNGPINVQNLIGNLTDLQVSVEDDYAEHFKVNVSTRIKILANDLNSLVNSVGNKNTLIVKLIASKESTTTETTLLIDLSDIEKPENPGVCSVDRIENLNTIYENPDEILDTYVGVIEKLHHVNLDDAYMNNSLYLEARLDNGFLIISTTLEYMKYEDNEQSNTVTATLVTKCADEINELEYIVYIEDTNNHQPMFEEEHYEFLFYDHIPNSPDFDLNQFTEIAATDKDLTTTNITFAIEDNKYLSLEYGGKTVRGSNRFYATLSLKSDITAYFNETYEITATDSGVPPLSSTAKLTLTVLRGEAPVFTQSLYKAFLTEENKIIVTNGPIALEDITSFDDLTFDISMEYDAYFTIVVDDEIKINVKKDVDLTGLISPYNTSIVISLYAEGLFPKIYAESSLLLDMSILLDNIETTTDDEGTTEFTDTTAVDSSTPEPQPPVAMPGLDNWLGYSLSVMILFAALASGLIAGFAVMVWMIALAKKRDAKKAAMVVTEKI